MNVRQRALLGGLVLGLAAGVLAATAGADDKKAAGATGTWKSSFTRGDGQVIETIYKLKQDGQKLTGTVKRGEGKEREIEEGTVKDGKVSFQTSGERDGQKFTVKHTGTVDGDTIKGKIEFTSGDNKREFDWEAKRQKD
jgi:hypothetical protein